MKFEEVKKDYLYIIKKFGKSHKDMSIDAENTKIDYVLLNPSKTNAKKYMLKAIQRGFYYGDYWLSADHDEIYSIRDNPDLKKLHDKYILKKLDKSN